MTIVHVALAALVAFAFGFSAGTILEMRRHQ